MEHIEWAMDELENKWDIVLIAIVMDTSGECRKAKKILQGKYPWLIILDCYAHQVCHISFHSPHIFTIVAQINLVVGDLFKCLKGDIVKFTKKATEFIDWLCGKTIILAYLHQLQNEAGLAQLSVVHAVLTQWTLHYLAYQRLLKLKTQLTLLVAQDKNQHPHERIVVTWDTKAKAMSRKMVRLITDELLF